MSDSSDHGHKAVTVLALALLVFTLFQLTQVISDRMGLAKVKAQLDQNVAQADKALDEGTKMLDKLNDVSIATQKLADAGNANAKDIVTQLNKAGIKINPDFKKGQPPAGAPKPGAPKAPAPAPAPAKP